MPIRTDQLFTALPGTRQKLASPGMVVKVGGNDLDDPAFVNSFVAAVADRRDQGVIVVHGGGKGIGRLQKQLGLEPRFVEGLRVTDAPSLEAAQMVLSGQLNKRLVARLVSAGVPAMGLSGVDGGLLRVEKLHHPAGDLGLVGHVVKVNTRLLIGLLDQDLVPVISPISLGMDGQAYNVNADHAALAVARAMNVTSAIFLTNVPGVLQSGRIVPHLSAHQAETLIAEGVIAGGMVPKIRSALAAVSAGVGQAVITDLAGLCTGSGTVIR